MKNKNIEKDLECNEKKQSETKNKKAKIFISRQFGTQDFNELYTDYVAKTVGKQMYPFES